MIGTSIYALCGLLTCACVVVQTFSSIGLYSVCGTLRLLRLFRTEFLSFSGRENDAMADADERWM